MQRNFTDENFEGFLRQSSDGLRMRPSDQVWKEISSRLNQRRRRTGFLLGLLLLISGGTAYFFIEQQNASATTTAVPNTTIPTVTASPAYATAALNGPSAPVATDLSGERRPASFIPSLRTLSLPHPAATLRTGIYQNGAPFTDAFSFQPTVADSYFQSGGVEEENQLHPVTAADPMTIESIFNSFNRKKGKLGLQIYLTPTVSYRKLSENKDYLNSLPRPLMPIANPDYDNINSAVTHKPDFGFELGLAAKYPVSKKTKLRAGLQFNVNRYEIKTYNTSTELATIRLNNRNGADSLKAVTNYNNFGGYKSNWLENFYFQVAAPVGVEVNLKGDERVQFGIATTLQPTYVIGDRVYLISTDYKNYAEVPRLIRRWNLNTNLETYVAYSTGRLKWQVGPQVRYQLLSSFVKKYPVKEHLFDFGLKMGVSLNGK